MSKPVSLSNSKSICVILVVVGCFLVLWPKIFYPMLLCGLNWNNQAKYSFERNVNEQILPPKVRESMKLSPVRDQGNNVQKLPGRPQFYTGSRDRLGAIEKGPSSNSLMNLMMPVYAILIVLFFLYTMFKISFGSDNDQSTPSDREQTQSFNCNDCYYEQNRSKKFDPYSSRSTYRAFNSYGRNNVSRSLHSLIHDMEIFRSQLVKANICQCKLKKYEMAQHATENCLQTVIKEEDQKQDVDQKVYNDNSVDVVQLNSVDCKIIESVETCLENNENDPIQPIQLDKDKEEPNESSNIDEEKENFPVVENIDPDLETCKNQSIKLRKRKKKTNNTSQSCLKEIDNENNENSNKESTTKCDEELVYKIDAQLLEKLNTELDKLMVMKDKTK